MKIRSISHVILILAFFYGLLSQEFLDASHHSSWQLQPFNRTEGANPILLPRLDSYFYCPIQNKNVHWEGAHVFNPAAVVRGGKVYLFYRGEDNFGNGVGLNTSRIGVAISSDGIHFERMPQPVLYPGNDGQSEYEFPGGCEDPRIVETEEGTYVMTYTQWNRKIAVLAIATSHDLIHWQKHGYAFQFTSERIWSKSGSIVCRLEGGRMIATKINGQYWMYWGDTSIFAATSDNLIDWTIVRRGDYQPLPVVSPREGEFDSDLAEAGPPAIVTKKGILLLYNGKNSRLRGDPTLGADTYSAGQVLFDLSNPIHVVQRSEKCFLTPKRPYELTGQYNGGTVFIQGLVHFLDRWFLYYGCADSAIGVATSKNLFNISDQDALLL